MPSAPDLNPYHALLVADAWRKLLRALADADARGVRELTIARSLDLGEACGWALALDPPVHVDAACPVGWGIYPPRGDIPCAITLKAEFTDVYGNRAEHGTHGIVGCAWHDRARPDRIVVRCWFRGDDGIPSIGPIDVYDTDLAGEVALYRYADGEKTLLPYRRPGWAVGRLDPAPGEIVVVPSHGHARLGQPHRPLAKGPGNGGSGPA